jgi:hypothetical protein
MRDELDPSAEMKRSNPGSIRMNLIGSSAPTNPLAASRAFDWNDLGTL